MEVTKVCIVGAGTMGTQLAQLAAATGYKVSMVDIEERILEASFATIKGSLKKFFVDKGKMTQEEADKVVSRIEGTLDLERAVKAAQVAIECIPEDMELKQHMFQRLDELCAPETILATNTSSLTITAIGSLTQRQDKVIGMHFFNPVGMMRLVEIIRGPETSDETYQVIKDVSAQFGKETITVNKDTPGFVVVRLFAVLANEAVRMLEEGIATVEDIDKGCQLGLGHAMGPLKTHDITNGIPVTLHCLDYMREQLGDYYRPCTMWRTKVWTGQFGVKTGKGFYDYSQQQ